MVVVCSLHSSLWFIYVSHRLFPSLFLSIRLQDCTVLSVLFRPCNSLSKSHSTESNLKTEVGAELLEPLIDLSRRSSPSLTLNAARPKLGSIRREGTSGVQGSSSVEMRSVESTESNDTFTSCNTHPSNSQADLTQCTLTADSAVESDEEPISLLVPQVPRAPDPHTKAAAPASKYSFLHNSKEYCTKSTLTKCPQSEKYNNEPVYLRWAPNHLTVLFMCLP